MKQGWEYKKIGSLCVIKTGKLDANAASPNGKYPFFTCSRDTLRIDDYAYNCECVLIAGNGELNVKYYKGKFNAYQRTYIVSLAPSINIISTRYLFCFFSKYIETLRQKSIGGVIKYIKLGDLTNALIPIPPLSEQQRIVEELDLLGSIIEKKKAQLAELDKLAQSLFYEMFGSNSYTVVTLADVVEINSSLVSPVEYPYSEMLHVSPANIVSGTGELIDCMKAKEEKLISGKYTFSKGMVLYSKIRPNLNKVTIPQFDGICSADMYPLAVKDKANNVFIWRLLLSKEFLEYAIKHSGRARMPKLNRETLFGYKFPLPPLSLQQLFADKVQAIEHQKELIKQSIAEVETLFNSRMDYYFN